jgi:prepilin-type N-terminal cleavage/methylation domain-containing protein
MNPAPNQFGPAGAFTLVEMLLALAIAAVVLVAINAVLFGGLHLQARTTELTAQTLPMDHLVATIRQDLLGIVPIGNLAGPMGTDATPNGMTQPSLLELFTSTGSINDDVPWGDIQKIDYSLQTPTNAMNAAGRDLVRGVTRNLLASTPEAPVQQVLIGGVQNLQLSFFDGTNWNDSWSTTLSNTPVEVKVSISFAAPKTGGPARPTVQFTVPVVIMASTNSYN